MLQRARSLRRVHHDEQPAHKRQSSSSSDASRASSSGSDSSSSSRENTPEWDPLRLHPSMEVDRSPHITPVYHAHRHDHHHHHHRNQHQHQQHEGGRHPQIVEHQAEYHPPRHTTQQGATLQIYGGFDFGFEKPQPLSPADGDIGRHHRLRAPRSETDLHRRHDAAAMGSGAEWNGLPSPVRRIRPAGYDEADDFIKRGGWKRRGIVFGSSEPAHDAEDNCFDVI